MKLNKMCINNRNEQVLEVLLVTQHIETQMNEEILKNREMTNTEFQKKKPKRKCVFSVCSSHALIKDAVRLSRKTE